MNERTEDLRDETHGEGRQHTDPLPVGGELLSGFVATRRIRPRVVCRAQYHAGREQPVPALRRQLNGTLGRDWANQQEQKLENGQSPTPSVFVCAY